MIDFLKYPFQSESTLYSCLSVKQLQALRNWGKGGRGGGGAKVDQLTIILKRKEESKNGW